MSTLLFRSWLVFVALCSSTDGFLFFSLARCTFNSTDLKDIQYIFSYYYNKQEAFRFDSSLGLYVGFTELGIKNAERLNKDPLALGRRRAQRETYCKHNVDIYYRRIITKSVTPRVELRSDRPFGAPGGGALVCSAYDFYPKLVKVSWLRDGREVKAHVVSTQEMADGDWHYQIHSQLEHRPGSGEKISCVVEHASLMKPLVVEWDPSMPASERNKIAVGASGLILGLTLSLAGFIYYKKSAGVV